MEKHNRVYTLSASVWKTSHATNIISNTYLQIGCRLMNRPLWSTTRNNHAIESVGWHETASSGNDNNDTIAKETLAW